MNIFISQRYDISNKKIVFVSFIFMTKAYASIIHYLNEEAHYKVNYI